MNKVILMGRLTREPDIRWSQDEQSAANARFTLAVDRRYKRDENVQADFIQCFAVGKIAEFLEKYCHKGTKLVIEGRIQTGSYTNKEGQKIYTTDIFVESAEFAESKASASYNNTTTPDVDEDGFMSIPENVDEYGFQVE
jgi:single-strand DNA-binding protein